MRKYIAALALGVFCLSRFALADGGGSAPFNGGTLRDPTTGPSFNATGPGQYQSYGIPLPVTPTAALQTASRGNYQIWFPGTEGDGAQSSGTFGLSGGRTFIDTVTVPADATAVWPVFGNGSTAAWTLSEAAIGASAQWGCASGFAGVTSCDLSGATIPAYLPVTFANGGVFRPAFPPTAYSISANANPTSFTAGGAIVPLVLASAASPAATTLSVTSAVASNMMGGISAQSGMYVADGGLIGCIAPNTTFTLSGTTLTLSNTVLSPGCAVGQTIWASWAPLGPQSISVPLSANPPASNLVFADPISLATFYRTDGPISAGMTVGTCGGALPAGATVNTVYTDHVLLSASLLGTCNGNSQIAFSLTTTAATAALVNSDVVQVTSTTGITQGMAVSGTNVPAGAIVALVCSNATAPCANASYGSSYVKIIGAAGANPIATQIASGTVLTFSVTARTSGAVSSGNSLPLLDTSANRILSVRGVAAGAVWVHTAQFNNFAGEHIYAGLPLFGALGGPTSTDCVNYIANCLGGTAGMAATAAPLYGLVVQTRARGLLWISTGDSHAATDTTVSGNVNAVRLTANYLSTPHRPISSINVGQGAKNCNIWCGTIFAWMQAVPFTDVFLPAMTPNGGDSSQTFEARVDAIAAIAQASGARVHYLTDFPRGSAIVAPLAVNGAISGTMVNLLATIPALLDVGGSGLAVTALAPNASCIPSGTTAALQNAVSNTLTLSQSVTCPAGTILTLGVIPATIISGNASVTLGTPAPFSGGGLVSGANLGTGCTLTTTSGSTAATLSSAGCATGSGASTLTFSTSIWSTVMAANADILSRAGPLSAISVFDQWPILEAPGVPQSLNLLYTIDGVHADDCGVATLAGLVCPLVGPPAVTGGGLINFMQPWVN